MDFGKMLKDKLFWLQSHKMNLVKLTFKASQGGQDSATCSKQLQFVGMKMTDSLT